jgi:hypothetical protein
MTALPATRPSTIPRLDASTGACLLALAAIFLMTHAYGGIAGDSKIYMGRALADLDPSGVGRDP